MPGSLSATNIATHHHLNCDLYLHYVYHGASTPNGSHKPRPSNEPSELSKAQFERGVEWEASLFAWLDRQGLLLTVLSGPMTQDALRETIDLDDRDHFFIAGASFWPPKEKFQEEFARAGSEPVNFGLAKPDLIEIKRDEDGGVTWQVIDAKASKHVKTSHHVQIYFYHLCISYLLPSYQAPATTASVWLPPSSSPDSFTDPSFADLHPTSIPLLADSLHAFLFRRLPTLLAQPRTALRWHLNPLCRGCPFEPADRARAQAERTLGAMPHLSIADARALEGLLALSRRAPPVSDIEDLHALFADPARAAGLERAFPSSMKTAKRILGVPPRAPSKNPSAVLAAALAGTPQIIRRRSYTLPRREDAALVLSLLLDPATDSIAAFALTAYPAPAAASGRAAALIPALARCIRALAGTAAQVYVFTGTARAALQRHLIDAALLPAAPAHAADVRLCVGALCEGAALLATAFQPLVLGGALLDFLGRKGDRRKAALAQCLARMGIEPRGTAEQMRVRIKEEVDRLKAPVDGARGVVGQLPRVVALKREIERLVALPVPGYWELQECVEVLGVKAEVPSEEAVYESYRTGELDEAIALMGKRNDAIYAVLCEVRSRVQEFGLLVNDARPLDAAFMDLCKEEHMRKLFYMQQFEVLAKLTELWQTRIDGCPDAPILEYRAYTPGASPTERTTHTFALVSGTLDVPADKDRAVSFFDYLLVEDTDADDDVPLEALFDDLPVMGLMFPLNRWTRARWDAQHDRVRAGALLADVRDVGIDAAGRSTAVAVHTWGEMRLGKGKRYRLSPRLVDFNLAKVLATLLELDMRCESEGDDEEEEGEDVPFLQLISDPRALSGGEGEKERAFLRAEVAMQSMFRQLHELGSEPAGRLLLKQSQRHATRRILSSRLAVVWGPPGTGKTHTITASLLRLLECEASMNTEPQIIFLTAMTHAAIEACLSKLESLMACYRAIPSLPTRWLDKVKVEHVLKGGDHPLPARGTPNSHIYAGTVYQLYNFSKRRVLDVDCVVIDEAGQLSLGAAALALRSLAPNGRIVIAGDSEQLAPIFTAQYPRLETRLFGSILDCVMHLATGARERDDDVESVAATDLSSEVVSSQVSTVVQLTENFRLNPDLGDFVSTIYSRAFKPQKVQVRHLATRLGALDEGPASDGIAESARSFLVALSRAMLRDDQELLRPPLMASIRQGRLQASDPLSAPLPISLALIRLKAQTRFPTQIGYETHVRGEAAVAASLVRCLQTVSPEDEVFVATPHRIQRHAVKEALNAMPPMASTDDDLTDAMGSLNVVGGAMSKVTIDTVERLQGSEAAFVICLFSDTSSRSASLDFLLERRRLNVAISRAKTLCILVTSDEVLRPAVGVLANEEAAKGYAFLRAFEERAWSGTINVDLDDL